MNEINIAVIIPHKDDEKSLEICLALLARQITQSVATIVVDNGSRDPSGVGRVCAKYGAQLEICLEGGSYNARNVGIRSTGADLLIFTDADCQPCPMFIDGYSKWFRLNNGLIAAGPVEAIPRGKKPNGWECLDIDTGYPQERHVRSGMAITANLAVRRSAVEEFGEFDGTLYSGGDIEFSRRIARKSGGINWVANAIVYHPARRDRVAYVERMKRVNQGVAAMRVKSGLSPVAGKTWLLVLIPPLARIPRLARIPGVTVVSLIQAFLYACYLRFVLLLFLISIRKREAVINAAGKFK